MGLIIGAGNTKPAFPYDYYYGVQIDTTVADPTLTRVGRAELHVSLPIQNGMRRCLLDDDGNVVTYLHPTDSTKTDTGAKADLTGASGMVMVELPEHYRKFEFDGTKITALLSQYALPGFHKVRKIYRSAYEAALDRTNNKLASVVNDTTQYRGGNNNSSYDGTYRTMLGRPATNISLTDFRKYARARGTAGLNGAGWNCDLYEAQLTTYWLFVVEYATLNCQAAFTAELTSEGYHQGGLGDGVTKFGSYWSSYNSNNPFVPCGATNSLGNATGVVSYDVEGSDGNTLTTVSVPSYRGIENPFGHVWSWTDGVHVRVCSAASGDVSEFYRATDDNPANFQDSNYTGYTKRGEIARGSNYVKSILCGEYGDNMPLTVGGSSTTYFCDYHYTNIPGSGEALRGVLFGGRASHDAAAGLSCALTNDVPTYASAGVGSRLCFIPAA